MAIKIISPPRTALRFESSCIHAPIRYGVPQCFSLISVHAPESGSSSVTVTARPAYASVITGFFIKLTVIYRAPIRVSRIREAPICSGVLQLFCSELARSHFVTCSTVHLITFRLKRRLSQSAYVTANISLIPCALLSLESNPLIPTIHWFAPVISALQVSFACCLSFLQVRHSL